MNHILQFQRLNTIQVHVWFCLYRINFEVKCFIFDNLILEIIYIWIVLIKITFKYIIYKEMPKINYDEIKK